MSDNEKANGFIYLTQNLSWLYLTKPAGSKGSVVQSVPTMEEKKNAYCLHKANKMMHLQWRSETMRKDIRKYLAQPSLQEKSVYKLTMKRIKWRLI